MNVKPIIFSAPMVRALLEGRKSQTRRKAKKQDWPEGVMKRFPNQHGTGYERGDVLWVREGWTQDGVVDGMVAYRADGESPSHIRCKWRSPIHMPRWASRLTLVVTDVRVQRLQEVTDEDAVAEGIEKVFYDGTDEQFGGDWGWRDYLDHPHAVVPFDKRCQRLSFETLWRSIHGPGSWDANPWVVALTFTVHPVNVDAFLAQRSAA